MREAVTFSSGADAVVAAQMWADGLLAGARPLRVLEAGAGKRTRLDLPPDAHVVGVDNDEVALRRNARLNVRVLSDLSEYDPGTARFDLIVCWYVLEHVTAPERLVERFASWLAPGGVLVLAVPHLWTPKSVVAKVTPHRFHIWFRRRVLGAPNAGRPGYGPYPTVLARSISPRSLRRRVRGLGLMPVMVGFFEDEKQRRLRARLRVTGPLWAIVRGLSRLCGLDAARTELVLVARDPAAQLTLDRMAPGA